MRLWCLCGALLLAACNDAGYEAVTIRPTYGWADGCTDVKISGHGFADDVSATIGGEAVTDVTPATLEVNREFFFYATTPPATGDMVAAHNDVVVTSDGEDSTIPNGFYYVACMGAPLVEDFGVVVGNDFTQAGAPVTIRSDAITTGDTVEYAGCNLPTGGSVVIADPTGTEDDAAADLTNDCSTAIASFEAPTLTGGATYWIFLLDDSDAIIEPACAHDACTPDPRDCVAGDLPTDNSGAAQTCADVDGDFIPDAYDPGACTDATADQTGEGEPCEDYVIDKEGNVDVTGDDTPIFVAPRTFTAGGGE